MITLLRNLNTKLRLSLWILGLQGLAVFPAGAVPLTSGPRLELKPGEQAKSPVLLGIYTQGYLGTEQVVQSELLGLDRWAGKQTAIAASFINLEDSNPAYNIPVPLERLRQHGYTAFINVNTTRSMAEIAEGRLDRSMQKLAKAYAAWAAKGENRMAFVAPFPEMNGDWEPYGQDPKNFKRAYERLQSIFTQAGVAPGSIRWVFAPNGWSTPQHPFEAYYPGNQRVDVVAFSSYNWGYCRSASWKQWQGPEVLFGPYLSRMRRLAPGKPIFVAQTATTSDTPRGSQPQAKDSWLRQSYAYLANAPGVRGVLYFNLDKECDWSIYRPGGSASQGYRDAIANPAFGYQSPQQLFQLRLRDR